MEDDGEEEEDECTLEEGAGLRSHCQQLAYTSHPTFRLSDHRPVSALFRVTAVRIDAARFEPVVASIKPLVEPMEEHISSLIHTLYPSTA